MSSLEQELRESNDSLDSILKKHNTNLTKLFGTEKHTPQEYDSEYERFKDYYYNHLDMDVLTIQRVLGLNPVRWSEYRSKAISETGLKRVGGVKGTYINKVKTWLR